MYKAEILADSISSTGVRLTTMEVCWPHAIHKDMMTHRDLSRNFLSFRAYPPEKLFNMVQSNPFIPEIFFKRAKGMASGEPHPHQDQCREIWLHTRDVALEAAKRLTTMEVDKGTVNILLQDFCWITGIVSATKWNNFFNLRAMAPEGQKPRPEVEKIAQMMLKARMESEPELIKYGQWHLPLTDDFPLDDPYPDWETWKTISAGRCARASYFTHHGVRDLDADIGLCDSLIHDTHMSPLEHQATPTYPRDEYDTGNFHGWLQFRKQIPGESGQHE